MSRACLRFCFQLAVSCAPVSALAWQKHLPCTHLVLKAWLVLAAGWQEDEAPLACIVPPCPAQCVQVAVLRAGDCSRARRGVEDGQRSSAACGLGSRWVSVAFCFVQPGWQGACVCVARMHMLCAFGWCLCRTCVRCVWKGVFAISCHVPCKQGYQHTALDH